MIVDLPSTNTATVVKKLMQLRDNVGSMALGRVLTLVVVVDEDGVDEAVEIANSASRQHPCRVIVLVTANGRGAARLDAQIRLGGDAGASEVVVLRMYGPLAKQGRAVVTPLLLPDSPVVVWWPREAPVDPAADPVGAMAQRRITDSARAKRPATALSARGKNYRAGDTDLAWTRLTLWRGQLAAALDEPPYVQVTGATVTGAPDSPSVPLLAGWLAQRLRCPVRTKASRAGSGLVAVTLEREDAQIEIARPSGSSATITRAGQRDRRIALPPRGDAECLADELHRLDPDQTYADALIRGMPQVRALRD